MTTQAAPRVRFCDLGTDTHCLVDFTPLRTDEGFKCFTSGCPKKKNTIREDRLSSGAVTMLRYHFCEDCLRREAISNLLKGLYPEEDNK